MNLDRGGGRRVLRTTVDYLSGDVSRVIDFAGIAEIRADEGPDDDGDGHPDGLMFVRVPVGGAVSVEDARSLIDGSQVADESGYIHADIRGSVLAKTAIDGPAMMSREAAYGAWGEPVEASKLDRPRHQFVDFEPDKATGYYLAAMGTIAKLPKTVLPHMVRGTVLARPRPDVSEEAEVLDDDWVMCPKCTESWEVDPRLALCQCPSCERMYLDPYWHDPLQREC